MDRRQQFWRTKFRYLIIFLSLWFVVGQILPVFAVDYLNHYKIGGWPLGIWFAFQGSLILFVILFFVYNYLMGRLEKKYNINE